MPDRKKKKPLVPKLRFPEFRDAGEWEVKRLWEVCDVLQGYGFPERFQGKQKGEYPFCKVSDITKAVNENGGHLITAANYVDREIVEELRANPIPAGATVFAKIGEALRLNKRALVDIECLIDNNVAGLKAREEFTPDYFIFLLSQNIDMNKHCGGAVPSVNKSTLKAIKIVVPIPPEQQKIADCLSSLDELIELEAQRCEALKAHKKGLMQQLFPREGETTPRLRFPGFRNAGPWEVKRLGRLIETVTPPKKLKTSDYLDKGRFPVIDQSQDEICGWTNDKEAIIREKFPLVIFGDHTCTVKMSTKPFAQGADGIKILAAKSEIDPRYLYQYLLFSPIEQKQYKRHFSILKEKLVYFPPIDLGEQQKIAECLSSLDELIELQSRKVEALKQHKKGLMQQLFPQEVI